MTTEVLVMNASAVAMAADTAVSIPYGTGTKTYTRARKLMPLHETQPVAVMVWDAPGHLSLPWEVIVGEFRKNHQAVLNELDQYVAAFFDFVDTEAGKWAAGTDEITLLKTVLVPEIYVLQQLWSKRLDADDRPDTDAAIAAAAADAAQEFVTITRRKQLEDDRWTRQQASDLASLDPSIREHFAVEAASLWDKLDAAARAELVELGRERMVHIVGDEYDSSGLVFAGYGSNELFAQARVWRVSGRLAGKTRRVERRRFAISRDQPSIIVPVGQEGVINSFLKGIHPDVDKMVSDLARTLTVQLGGGEAIATAVKDGFDSEVVERGQEVTRAVEFLPAGDLAVVAGDLIRMTALRNRATITADTVGGPIDVILLSRSEGFRWVEPPDGFRIERDDR
jgi:hypothetical protein